MLIHLRTNCKSLFYQFKRPLHLTLRLVKVGHRIVKIGARKEVVVARVRHYWVTNLVGATIHVKEINRD